VAAGAGGVSTFYHIDQWLVFTVAAVRVLAAGRRTNIKFKQVVFVMAIEVILQAVAAILRVEVGFRLPLGLLSSRGQGAGQPLLHVRKVVGEGREGCAWSWTQVSQERFVFLDPNATNTAVHILRGLVATEPRTRWK